MLKTLYTMNDKNKNKNLVDAINSRLKDLREEIEGMGKKEKKIENHIKQ